MTAQSKTEVSRRDTITLAASAAIATALPSAACSKTLAEARAVPGGLSPQFVALRGRLFEQLARSRAADAAYRQARPALLAISRKGCKRLHEHPMWPVALEATSAAREAGAATADIFMTPAKTIADSDLQRLAIDIYEREFNAGGPVLQGWLASVEDRRRLIRAGAGRGADAPTDAAYHHES